MTVTRSGRHGPPEAHRSGSDRSGQRPDRPGKAAAEPEAINNGPEPPRPAHRKQAKEVFEMAASLFIEEESGTYTGRFRHPHNGYYAGDFSQSSRSGSELRVSYTERRDVRTGAADPAARTGCAPASGAVMRIRLVACGLRPRQGSVHRLVSPSFSRYRSSLRHRSLPAEATPAPGRARWPRRSIGS